MSGSNAALLPEEFQPTEQEANGLARDIATERFTQKRQQHYGAYLEAAARRPMRPYDDAELGLIWEAELRQALHEVQCGLDLAVMARVRQQCAERLAMAFTSPVLAPAPATPAGAALVRRYPPPPPPPRATGT